MSKRSKRGKVLLKLQALVIAIGSDSRKFNPELQAIANDIDELYESGTEALSNSGGSDSSEPHAAIPSEQSIEEQLKEILFFQSQPGSSNMLADWQIKDATKQILKLVDKATRESRLDLINAYLEIAEADGDKNKLSTGHLQTDLQHYEELSNKEVK